MTGPATSRWRTSLRIGRRMVARSRARSVLIVALVALPVLAGTFAAVMYRTKQLSPDQVAQRVIGTADAAMEVTTQSAINHYSLIGRDVNNDAYENTSVLHVHGSQHRDPSTVDVPALLPADAHAIPAGWERAARVTSGDHAVLATAVLLDLADPLTTGIYDVTAGAPPRAAGEAALTTDLAARLHADVGDDVSLKSGRTLHVSAIVQDPNDFQADDVVGPPATFPTTDYPPVPRSGTRYRWIAGFPGTAPDLHDALARDGVVYATRDQWANPPVELGSKTPVDTQLIAILTAIAGFGLLEIVLLAGTAFAVGARRQVRELGTVQAAGGDDTDVRRVVLAQGLVLGGAGAIVGVGLGVLAAYLAQPAFESYLNHRLGPFDVRPLDLLAVLAIGLLAGLLAAVVPARSAAHMSVIDMLRARFSSDGAVRRPPRWAWIALVAGPAIVIGGAAAWHDAREVKQGSEGFINALTASTHDTLWTSVIIVGTAITLAGLIRLCPALLVLLSRSASNRGLTARLATRDATRHHHRTVPAVAAVMTVLAGAVLVMFTVSSIELRGRNGWTLSYPLGTVSVNVEGNSPQHGSTDHLAAVTRQVANEIGADAAYTTGWVVPAGAPRNQRLGTLLPGCDGRAVDCYFDALSVGSPGLVEMLAGHPVPGAASMLARGGVVIFNSQLHADKIRVAEITSRRPDHVVTLPVLVVRDAPFYGQTPKMLVSAATPETHGWDVEPMDGLIVPTGDVSQEQIDRINSDLGRDAFTMVEEGYQGDYSPIILILIAVSLLAAVGGTSIAVALALAESRADMATLAAVGAPPFRRRLHAMAQAATVGGLGAALGLGLGLLVSISLLQGSTSYPTSVPFRWLALLVVATPALAAAVAGVATRGTVPLTRRIT